jgi:hypothetical protein
VNCKVLTYILRPVAWVLYLFAREVERCNNNSELPKIPKRPLEFSNLISNKKFHSNQAAHFSAKLAQGQENTDLHVETQRRMTLIL